MWRSFEKRIYLPVNRFLTGTPSCHDGWHGGYTVGSFSISPEEFRLLADAYAKGSVIAQCSTSFLAVGNEFVEIACDTFCNSAMRNFVSEAMELFGIQKE